LGLSSSGAREAFIMERIVSTSSGGRARSTCARERVADGVGVSVGARVAVGVGALVRAGRLAGVSRSTWPTGAPLGDGVAVGGGVDVLVGVGVGGDWPVQPAMDDDRSTSVLHAIKKTGNAASDARRTTGVRSIKGVLLLARFAGRFAGNRGPPLGISGTEYRKCGVLSNAGAVSGYPRRRCDKLIGFGRQDMVYYGQTEAPKLGLGLFS
jgi:hypothetical protein